SSLSQRPEDIPILVDHLWSIMARELRKNIQLSSHARDLLCQHDFPGNIRELKNILERMGVLGQDRAEIGIDCLPPEIQAKREVLSLDEFLREAEITKVTETMSIAAHDPVKAARILKISLAELSVRVQRHHSRYSNSILFAFKKAA